LTRFQRLVTGCYVNDELWSCWVEVSYLFLKTLFQSLSYWRTAKKKWLQISNLESDCHSKRWELIVQFSLLFLNENKCHAILPMSTCTYHLQKKWSPCENWVNGRDPRISKSNSFQWYFNITSFDCLQWNVLLELYFKM